MGKNGNEEKSCLDCVFQVGVYIWSDSELECDIVERALKSAKSNSVWNEFPDFICDNGFIEHFEITSAKQTGKGSKVRIQRGDMQREIEKFRSQLDNNQLRMVPGSVYSKAVKRKAEVATHEFLLSSLEKQWRKHLIKFDSYVKTIGQQGFSAFMVDLRYENLLLMLEDIPMDVQLSEGLHPIR